MSLILGSFLFPTLSYAQAEPVTQEQLQTQLDALQAQLIALLQQQLAELIAQLNVLIAAQSAQATQLGAVQSQVDTVVENTQPVQELPAPLTVSIGSQICKERKQFIRTYPNANPGSVEGQFGRWESYTPKQFSSVSFPVTVTGGNWANLKASYLDYREVNDYAVSTQPFTSTVTIDPHSVKELTFVYGNGHPITYEVTGRVNALDESRSSDFSKTLTIETCQ